MPSSLFEILVALQPLIQYALKKSHLFPKAGHSCVELWDWLSSESFPLSQG